MEEIPGRVALRFIPALALLIGCAPPATKRLRFDDPACAGTQPGNACLTLQFTVSDTVRQEAGDRCAGFAHWALYAGGDVGNFGPGNNSPLLGNSASRVDLTSPGATDAITVPNLAARSYQVLGFIGQLGPGHPSLPGDPVTLPTGPFDLSKNEHLEVTVVFDVAH